MKLPQWIPNPVSWLFAVLLLFFGFGVTIAWAVIIPFLLEIGESSPRVAWLGIFGLFVAPIPIAAGVHRFAHRMLESLDRERASLRHSIWAGLFAWMALIFVTTTTSFIMCVIDPPPIDPGSLFAAMHSPLALNLQTIIWIGVAAFVAHAERSSR